MAARRVALVPASVATLLVASLAGCLGHPDPLGDLPPDVPAGRTQIERALRAVVGDAAPTAHAWSLVSTATGPDGDLAGFAWRIPNGSLEAREPPPPDAGDPGFRPPNWVTLQGVPIVLDHFQGPVETTPPVGSGDSPFLIFDTRFALFGDSSTSVTDWGLIAFAELEGKLVPLAMTFAPTATYRDRSVPASVTGPVTRGPTLAPFQMRLSLHLDWSPPEPGRDLVAGQTIYFVLAARSRDPAEFAIALRPAPTGADPAPDAARLLADLAIAPPQALTPIGTGKGFDVPIHMEQNFRKGGALGGLEVRTESARLVEAGLLDARPTVTVRDAVWSSEDLSPAGWAYLGGYYWAELGHGTWAARGEVRGQAVDVEGVVAQNRLGGLATQLPYILLFGSSGFYVLSDGDGPSSLEFHLRVAGALDFVFYGGIVLGSPLRDLVGLDGARRLVAPTGLVPP